MFPLDRPTPPYRSIAEIAESENKDPVDVIIDLSLAKNLKQFFMQTLVNENQDHVLEMMRHPRSVVTFSDSGAHVSQIMDNSLQTHLLSHWVREKQALTLEQAVKYITYDTATHWGSTIAACCARAWRPTSWCSTRARSGRRCPRSSATCRPAPSA